jgi:hypothetical protein
MVPTSVKATPHPFGSTTTRLVLRLDRRTGPVPGPFVVRMTYAGVRASDGTLLEMASVFLPQRSDMSTRCPSHNVRFLPRDLSMRSGSAWEGAL